MKFNVLKCLGKELNRLLSKLEALEVGHCFTLFVYVWESFYTLCCVGGSGIVAISLNNPYIWLPHGCGVYLREMNWNGDRWWMCWTIKQQTASNDFHEALVFVFCHPPRI